MTAQAHAPSWLLIADWGKRSRVQDRPGRFQGIFASMANFFADAKGTG